MQVHFRPTNRGETRGCSLKEIKSIFANTELRVCFDEASAEKLDVHKFGVAKYIKKNVSGPILCKLTTWTHHASSELVLYVIKERIFPEELRQNFIVECLPKLYDFYNLNLNNQAVIRKETCMFFELIDGKFVMHIVPTGRTM